MKRSRLVLLLGQLTLSYAACGDSFLSKHTVTHLPDGDAIGSDWSGTYEVALYTSACQGKCPVIDYGWYDYILCDVGTQIDDTVQIVQTDGHLQIDSDGGLMVSRFLGGVNADGSFDVGGWSTQEGGPGWGTIHA